MQHYSVLILDDDRRDVLEYAMREFATARNMRLQTAATMEEAERHLQSSFFHLALLDPRLGPKDHMFLGFVFLGKLAAQRPSCRRIILTELDRDSWEGADDIVGELH